MLTLPHLSHLATDSSDDNKPDFFIQLILSRETFLQNMTSVERKILTKHAFYLQEKLDEGKLNLAGPRLQGNPPPGIIILETANEKEAHEIIAENPAVKAGIFSFDIHPFKASIMSKNTEMLNKPILLKSDRKISKELIINAPVDKVWKTWTTVSGISTFFAPDGFIELAVGGSYEIYFVPDAPIGQKGSEGAKILSFVPQKMLSFTWNAPLQFGELREEKTWIVIDFASLANNKTHITLTHLGWQTGESWDNLYNYFQKAWDRVLSRLQYCFDFGPIDWKNPDTQEQTN